MVVCGKAVLLLDKEAPLRIEGVYEFSPGVDAEEAAAVGGGRRRAAVLRIVGTACGHRGVQQRCHVSCPQRGFLRLRLIFYLFFSSLPSSMFPFLLLPALVPAALVVADPTHISLARSGHPRSALDYHAMAEGTRAKYNYSTAAQISASARGVHGVLKRASTAGVPVINQVPSTVVALLTRSHISPEPGL